MKSIKKKFMVMFLSVAILLCSAGPTYAFGPITHGYIGQKTQEVVRLGYDGEEPNEYVFVSGAITADVGHLDKGVMHNAEFGEAMLDKALNDVSPDGISYSAGWIAHGTSDVVWADWLSDHHVSPGDPGPETFYKFLFDAYAMLFRGYLAPGTLYMGEDLIKETYGKDIPSPGLKWARAGIWAVIIVEELLVLKGKVGGKNVGEVLWLSFELSPSGAFKTVRDSFGKTTENSTYQSKRAIEDEWYDFEKVGTFSVSHMNRSYYKGWPKTWTNDSPSWPLLTDGWERSDPPEDVGYTERNGWSGYSVDWADVSDKSNPNVHVSTWAYPRGYVSVTVDVWKKRKKVDQTEKGMVFLQIPPDLPDDLAQARAARTFTIVDPLLTETGVSVAAIESRQNELTGNIGTLLWAANASIQEGNLAEVIDAQLVINNYTAFTDLITNTAIGFEKSLLNYYTLETKKQAILSGGDIIQPMPGEILPYGVEPEVPGGEPMIVFASDFDYFLAFDLVNFLKDHNYKPIRKVGTEWNDYKQTEKRIAVVGGSYSPQGVDSIIQELLTYVSGEERAELAEKGYLYTVLNDVFTEDQRIFLFVGKDSFSTRRATVDGAQLYGLYGEVFDGHGGPLLAEVPYRVVGNVEVPSDTTLTIQSGAEVYFQPGFKIKVEGTLNATGELGNPVKLFSRDVPNCGMKLMSGMVLKNGGEFYPGQ